MHVCMHACMHMCLYLCMWISRKECEICMLSVCMYMMCMYLFVYMHACVHMNVYACMHVLCICYYCMLEMILFLEIFFVGVIESCKCRALLCRPLPLDVGRCVCYITRERLDGVNCFALYTDVSFLLNNVCF